MEEKYILVFTGVLSDNSQPGALTRLFNERFGMDPVMAERIITQRRQVILTKDLEAAPAQALRRELEEAGVEVRIDPARPELSLAAEYETGQPREQPEPPPAAPSCPKCGSDRIDPVQDKCLACGIILSKYRRIQEQQAAESSAGTSAGIASEAVSDDIGGQFAGAPPVVDPYAAPSATLDTATEGEFSDPVTLPIARGGSWLSLGWGYFRASPLAWILSFVVMVGIILALGFIPVAGSLATNLLWPVFMGGLMLGCHVQDQGERFEVGHLFAGFSRNGGQLVLLGVFYLLFSLGIVVIVALVVGSSVFTLTDPNALQAEDPALMFDAMGGAGVALSMGLLVLALTVPLMMAVWFAPALIAIEGLSAFAAMKLSFLGTLRNMLPFLWYGLLMFVLFVVAAIPFGLGLLVASPVLFASIYAAYREIYYT